MAKDPITSVNEAVHKLQLCLLEGIQDENQLFAAGSLMSRSDYEDVVTERSICNMCGYPLCNKSFPSEQPRRGRYRISLKEHKVYDLHETYMYCSTSCVICSRAFAGSLQDERCSTFNTAKINEILIMFENTNLESDTDPGKSEDLGLSELKIHEKTDFKGGEVSLKKWIGPPNAIEGYVPKRDHTYRPLKSETCEEGDENDSKAHPLHAETSKPFLNEMDFKSTILTHDEQAVSKKFPENVSNLMPLHSKAQKKGSKHKKSDLKKGMDTIFNDVDFSSAIITQDEYIIAKTPVPADTFSNQRSKGSEENSCIAGANDRFTVSKVSSATMHNDSDMMLMNSSAAQIGSITTDKSTLTDVSSYHSQNGLKSAVDGVKEIHAEKSVQSSKTTTKSSLKSKGVKKVAHSVSWMDEKNGSLNGRNLCEVQELRNMKEGSETFKSTEIGNDDLEQLASAKACATALDQAAEAVESGVSRVTGAASEAGIILFPQQLETDGRECLDKVSTLEAEPAPVKWPRKSGLSDAECFDSKDSWFDAPPEGFSLTLSPFATMWNALFTWITSSSLAYIYGRAERFQGEYMFVNGREYPQKIVLPNRCSSEIKQTLAGFLAQALPSVIGDLKLPIPTSTLEQGLGNLLETMSFLDALPPFRVKQWQVIVLLFIDALSVCRIPRLAPHLTNRRMIIPKIGQGTYSNVYKAKDLLTGKIVALKKVRFDTLEKESVKFMAREIMVLRRLDHPNVVKLEGLVTSRMHCSLYLVFEYMVHDLAGLAASPEIKFTEAQVKCYAKQLLSGLEHCHNNGVLHRDIKGSNLLLDNGGILKIADFGLAAFFDPNHKHPMTSRVVTLWYRAPELLLGATDYGVGVDLWSAGCILAELLAGRPIMPGRTEVEQLHKIYKLCGSPSEDYWKKSKLPHATLFKPREPYKRCIRETFKDFPAASFPLIDTLLAIDPVERKTATDALNSEFFTTEPYSCDPSILPKYPPSKEIDAKRRDDEARRQKAAAKAHGDAVKKVRTRDRAVRAIPAAEANAELQSNLDRRRLVTRANAKSKSEKFPPPHEDGALGHPSRASRHIDPAPVPSNVAFSSTLSTYSKGSHNWSGPLVDPSPAGAPRQKKKTTANTRDPPKPSNLRDTTTGARFRG